MPASVARSLMPNVKAVRVADDINMAIRAAATAGKDHENLKLLLPDWAQAQYDGWLDEVLSGGKNLLFYIRRSLIAAGYTVAIDKANKTVVVWW
jgi:hypothetical protein